MMCLNKGCSSIQSNSVGTTLLVMKGDGNVTSAWICDNCFRSLESLDVRFVDKYFLKTMLEIIESGDIDLAKHKLQTAHESIGSIIRN